MYMGQGGEPVARSHLGAWARLRVERAYPPLGPSVAGGGASALLSGSGSDSPVLVSPLTLCFSPPHPQDTAQSPSTGLPATVTHPLTMRRSFPTTPSSTRTPWANRARWVSKRDEVGVLLPFVHSPLPISNPQQIGEGRRGHLKGFLFVLKINNQPNLTQFQRLSPSPSQLC